MLCLLLAWGLSSGCCAADIALLERSWGAELGALRSFRVSALTQGSTMSCVHVSAQSVSVHDSLGCADGLRAQFSSQARTTSLEQAMDSV